MRAAGNFMVITILSLFFIGSGCLRPAVSDQAGMNTQKISFETTDGVTIVGDLYRGPANGPAALLLHMMPSTKESWGDFAGALVNHGFSAVLAIDLRGHGESVMKGETKLDFLDFEDVEHQAKMRDVEAAVRWLEAQGIPKKRLALVGASIGANLAIAYGAANAEIPAVVALSPGLNYRGITTEDKMSSFAGRPLFLAASSEDGYSAETVRRLAALKTDATIKELVGSGHGTALLDNSAGFMDEVVVWLTKITP
jgi:pimeloyl-ACP methyl ester carboxylesterase